MGNNRLWMKWLANRGRETEVLMKIKFHKVNASEEDFIIVGSRGHDTDAEQRASQNERQRFVSSLRARRSATVDLFNFLKKYKLEYMISKTVGIMHLEGENPNKDWIVFSSIQGLNKGLGNGLFKKYGIQNVISAIKTCKAICKITNETEITYSALCSVCHMYKSLTEDHSDPGTPGQIQNLFTEKQLNEFFEALYKHRTNAAGAGFGSRYSKLRDLNQGLIKSFSYIAAVAFWPEIRGWYKENVNNGNGAQSFSHNNGCMKYFVEQAPLIVRSEVLKMVSS
jgi:hypothetical protein